MGNLIKHQNGIARQIANEPNGTTAVHGNLHARKPQPYHALTTPIWQTATYTFDNTADLIAYQEGKLWGGTGGAH